MNAGGSNVGRGRADGALSHEEGCRWPRALLRSNTPTSSRRRHRYRRRHPSSWRRLSSRRDAGLHPAGSEDGEDGAPQGIALLRVALRKQLVLHLSLLLAKRRSSIHVNAVVVVKVTDACIVWLQRHRTKMSMGRFSSPRAYIYPEFVVVA